MTFKRVMSFHERLWSKVARGTPEECWRWTAGKNNAGYGQVWRSDADGGPGRSMLAHRAVYEDVHGPIPAGVLVCHTCDHPWCVNPGHLFLGSHQDNVADMMAKGRQNHSPKIRGERHHLSKLTYRDAEDIRGAYAEGMSISSLARAYRVTNTAIVQVVRGITWKRPD